MDNDILQVQGINSKGFGLIPKLVMQDNRLTIHAKAIYSYFCTYAGAGKTAFPRATKIIKDLRISKNAYYTHFKLLKEYGYIKTEQKHVDGRLSHNIYTLMELIPEQSTLQSTTKQDTVKGDTHINNSIEKQQSFINNSPIKSSHSKEDGQDEKDTHTILLLI